jgi:hypothetical protein
VSIHSISEYSLSIIESAMFVKLITGIRLLLANPSSAVGYYPGRLDYLANEGELW